MLTINQLEEHLRKFNCMQGLTEIGKLSNQLYSSGKFLDNLPIVIDGLTHRRTITQWGLSFLAYRLILVSNDGRSKLIDWPNIARAHAIFGELDEQLSTDEEKVSFLLRLSQEQFWSQEFNMPIIWSRFIEIYKYDQFFSMSFYDITGLTLDEYFKLGLVFSVLISTSEYPTINLKDLMQAVYPVKTDDILTEDKLDRFLKLTAGTYETIRYEAGRINKVILPKYEKYEFNPLVKYPIILGDKRFPYYDSFQIVVPNILLLLDRIARGVYWDMRSYFEIKGSNAFLEKFGESFEEYCGKLLSRYFGDSNVFRVKDIIGDAHKDKRHSDWVVTEDGNIYLFECKSALIPIIARRTFLPPTMSSWVRRNIEHATTQLEITAKDLKDIGFIGSNDINKFILILEELYIADDPLIKQSIIGKHVNSNHANYSDVHIISVYEMEKMEQAIKKHRFANILAKKHELDKINGGNFLVACRSLDKEVALTNSYLESKFQDIISEWANQ